MAQEFRAVNWQGLTLAELEQRAVEALPFLIALWKAYLDGTSQEPTEEQLAAGFVQLLDKQSTDGIEAACDAIEPYEGVLYRYEQLLKNQQEILDYAAQEQP